MAAYAALVSVMNIIDTLQLHPNPPISLHNTQVESLTEKVSFLQQFLEGYNPQLPYSTEADPLESRIAEAAYLAEDTIESHVVDQITSDGGNISSDAMYEALERVIRDMALIEEEVMEIRLENVGVQHQLPRRSTPQDLLRSSSIAQKKSRQSSMVGADDVKLQMKDNLTSDRPDLQIIPIVGMGGSGKTTLALHIYQDRLIKEHFDIWAWAKISQEYNIREIFVEILSQLNITELGHHLSDDEIGYILYKHLCGRRYLLVMDDMWNIDAWNRVRNYFPDNKNRSRIVVTTRLSDLASRLSNSVTLKMKLLNEADSWKLLSKTVFGEEGCSFELEKIGKRIGKSCKGLPLSIVVVGGILWAKSEHKRVFWEYIEENLNATVNLDDDEHCLKVLHMSYKHLPIYLKPCFLYMGVYPEDEEIRISELIKLWVAEGFLKAVSGRSLEETAREYLEDLIGRYLVMIHEMGSSGNVKYCKVHDLLRDMCLREAEKQRFYTITPQNVEVNAAQRRIVISKNEDIDALSSMSLTRSLRWDARRALPPLSLRLLRVLGSRRFQGTAEAEFLENVHELVNSRFISFLAQSSKCKFPRSIWLFWNLQTIIADGVWNEVIVPADIWYMPHIRHIEVSKLYLPDPHPLNSQDEVVLGNLQTLGDVMDFKCSEEVVKRIPNIKKLKISFYQMLEDEKYCLGNLDRLNKLESLTFHHRHLNNQINFPHSLTKLTLWIAAQYCWPQDILDQIGELPLLQWFKLLSMRFEEGRWETNEGQFPSLKYLALRECENLQVWTTESSHFPCLEHLLLYHLDQLVKIPFDFADSNTLKVIDVEWCSESAIFSAKKIAEEQVELHGEEAALQVRVKVSRKKKADAESLKSANFVVV